MSNTKRDNTNQGNTRLRIAMVCVALFVFPTLDATVHAQALKIRTRDGQQTITHSLTEGTQTFVPVRWDIQNARYRNGCTVQWTAAAFEHETDPSHQADCQVVLRLAESTRESRWNITTAKDATDIATGRDTATVSLTANGRGHASVELLLRFDGSKAAELAAGRYRTTITGTISGL